MRSRVNQGFVNINMEGIGKTAQLWPAMLKIVCGRCESESTPGILWNLDHVWKDYVKVHLLDYIYGHIEKDVNIWLKFKLFMVAAEK